MSSLTKYERSDLTQEIREWLNTVVVKHIKNHKEDQIEIEHIIDYLLSDSAPKRLRRMSYAQAKAGSEKWIQLLKKKGAGIEETDEDVKDFIRYKSGFRFVKLLTKNAYDREGSLMSHCVSSYFGKDECEIYSLRDSLNNPHCTIEVKIKPTSSINQIKGKGNGHINPKYIDYVLNFLQKLDIKVKENELHNLGYINADSVITRGLTEYLKKVKGVKFKKINGVEYFYINSNLSVEKHKHMSNIDWKEVARYAYTNNHPELLQLAVNNEVKIDWDEIAYDAYRYNYPKLLQLALKNGGKYE